MGWNHHLALNFSIQVGNSIGHFFQHKVGNVPILGVWSSGPHEKGWVSPIQISGIFLGRLGFLSSEFFLIPFTFGAISLMFHVTAKSGVRDDGINPLDEFGGLIFFFRCGSWTGLGSFCCRSDSFFRNSEGEIWSEFTTYIGACLTPVTVFVNPRDPITFSDDEQGVYNHLRNERYLGSMKPFSVSVIRSLGK